MFTLHLDDKVIKSLSNHELNVLKYVYEHGDGVLDMSIHELARQVAYSSATVLRFCKKLGYSGYAEFKYALRMEARRTPKKEHTHQPVTISNQMIVRQICSNVEGTSKLLQEEQLLQTFQYFDSDCRIYLWAPGGITSILAEYFEKLLFSIGREKVYKIESAKMGEHILRSSPENAVWIMISTTGCFEPTVRLAKLAKMNSVPVISITPYISNEVAELTAVNFRFFTDHREYLGAEFTSRLPIFYMINMIIRCYLQYKEQVHQGALTEVYDDSAV